MSQNIKGGQGSAELSFEIEGVAAPGNKQNKFDEFVNNVTIIEGIDTPAIRAVVTFDDSADVISMLSGGETAFITIASDHNDAKIKYTLQLYKISDRVRSEKRNVYNLHFVSEEYLRNELVNCFGSHTKQKCEDYVGKFLGSDYINTDKSLYAEKTDEKFSFITPNWRPYNAINYLCEKAIRKKQTGSIRQSGYVFYENADGFHFVSIDSMIEDATKQRPKGEKSGTGGRPLPQLYYYGYGQANLPNMAEGAKEYTIMSVSFPKSYNLLENLRHGTFAGYTMGFDPVDMAKSSSGDQGADMPLALDEYAIREKWKDMAHMNPKGKPPFDLSKLAPQGEPSMVDTPRRVRLKPIMTRGYGELSKKDSKQSMPIGGQNVKSITEAASYNFFRMKSLFYQQLQVAVPGNLDLNAGYGVHITIPKALPNKTNSTRIPTDNRWSGLWLIAGVEHKYKDGYLTTSLFLVRDSTPESKGGGQDGPTVSPAAGRQKPGRKRRKGRVRKKRRGLSRRKRSLTLTNRSKKGGKRRRLNRRKRRRRKNKGGQLRRLRKKRRKSGKAGRRKRKDNGRKRRGGRRGRQRRSKTKLRGKKRGRKRRNRNRTPNNRPPRRQRNRRRSKKRNRGKKKRNRGGRRRRGRRG